MVRRLSFTLTVLGIFVLAAVRPPWPDMVATVIGGPAMGLATTLTGRPFRTTMATPRAPMVTTVPAWDTTMDIMVTTGTVGTVGTAVVMGTVVTVATVASIFPMVFNRHRDPTPRAPD